MTRACEVSARARPRALDASSIVPKASIRGSSFETRPPPSSPVVPSSPVPESSSIGLCRDGLVFLDEDLGELVQLLGHAPSLLDDLGDRHHLDVAVAPDRDHAALALHDELDGRHAKTGRPDPVDRRRRAATLQVAEDRHPGLETGIPLHRAGEDVANAALGETGMPERVLLGFPALLSLQLGDAGPFRDDDDAEELAL